MYNRTWGVWQLILHYLLNCTTAPGVWTAIVVECVIFKHLQTPHSSPEDVQRFVQKGKWLGNLECYTQMCWQLLSSICLLLQLKLTLNHSYESAKLFQDHGSFSPRTVYGNICAMTCTFHSNNAFWPSNCHCNLIECACVCVHVLASFPGLPTVQFLISIFAYFKRSKTGQWEGLRTRLHVFMKCVVLVRVFQSSQCNTVDFASLQMVRFQCSMVLASTHLYKHTHVDVLFKPGGKSGSLECNCAEPHALYSHKCVPRVDMSTVVSSKGSCGKVQGLWVLSKFGMKNAW